MSNELKSKYLLDIEKKMMKRQVVYDGRITVD